MTANLIPTGVRSEVVSEPQEDHARIAPLIETI